MSWVSRYDQRSNLRQVPLAGRRSRRHLGGGLFVLVLIFAAVLVSRTDGNRVDSVGASVTLPELPATIAPQAQLIADPAKLNLQAKSALLVDTASGVILYAKQPSETVAIASTTKMMTAHLVRQQLSLEQVVTITKEDVSIIGSDMELRTDEQITVHDLLAGLILNSGNDAAQALARTTSGSVDAFVREMNSEAAKLGMKDTHYQDPAGLDDTGRSTAFDLSVLARVVLNDPVIARLAQTSELQVSSVNGRVVHDLKNSNRLVGEYNYLGALGLKTGYTPEAGHCLVAAAERDQHRLFAIILHTDADTITASAIEARKLLDWGWANTTWE